MIAQWLRGAGCQPRHALRTKSRWTFPSTSKRRKHCCYRLRELCDGEQQQLGKVKLHRAAHEINSVGVGKKHRAVSFQPCSRVAQKLQNRWQPVESNREASNYPSRPRCRRVSHSRQRRRQSELTRLASGCPITRKGEMNS